MDDLNERYREEDKQAAREIMPEFEGVSLEHECRSCNGTGFSGKTACPDCEGKGSYFIEY